jgi:uncharacterized membrane protein
MTRRPSGDDGTVLVLVMGLAVVLLALVAVVVDVSIVALSRRAVSSAADGAAVSGAPAVEGPAYAAGGAAQGVPLSAAQVTQRVAAYGRRAALGQPGLELVGTVQGGSTVVVTARRDLTLPFSGWFGISQVTVRAESRARAPRIG